MTKTLELENEIDRGKISRRIKTIDILYELLDYLEIERSYVECMTPDK